MSVYVCAYTVYAVEQKVTEMESKLVEKALL